MEQTNPTTPKHSFKNIIILLFFAFVIVIISSITTYYYLSSKLVQQTEPVQQVLVPTIRPTIITDETANWKTYINKEGKYSLKYPQNWYFKSYEQKTKKAQAIFQNRSFDTASKVNDTKNGVTYGEIKIMTSNQIRGTTWANITEKEFYNPNNNFWLKGSGLGGGPGFTQNIPIEIKLGTMRAMMQRTHPDRPYEFVYPDQITNYIYVFLGNNTNEILIISYTYDQKNSDSKNNLNVFNQILSTFKFTQ